MTWHYTDSGLDNVYLENGYSRVRTPYGEGVSIQDTEGLHKAIGAWLIALPKPLNGQELRFIRIEMDLTQRDLAALVGTTEQTLRAWEKKRKGNLPGPADRLLRVIYSQFIGGDGTVRVLVNRLAELNQVAHEQAHFVETNEGWKAAA